MSQLQTVIDLIRDPQRIDRCIRRSEDGTLYATDNRAEPYVYVPWANEDISDEDAEEWAADLINQLADAE